MQSQFSLRIASQFYNFKNSEKHIELNMHF